MGNKIDLMGLISYLHWVIQLPFLARTEVIIVFSITDKTNSIYPSTCLLRLAWRERSKIAYVVTYALRMESSPAD